MIEQDRAMRHSVLQGDERAKTDAFRLAGNGKGLMAGVLTILTIVLVATAVLLAVLGRRGYEVAMQAREAHRAAEHRMAEQITAGRRAEAARQSRIRRIDSTSPAARVALGDPAEWIGPDDYPAEALRNGDQGIVSITWVVGADGRVSDCFTASSSGHVILDRAACAAITRRGRYPAIEEGAAPRIFTRRVNWQIPN